MKTANQKLLDELIGHEVDLSRLSNAQVVAIIKILNSKDAELRASLIEAIDSLGTDLSASTVDAALSSVLRLNQSTFLEIRQALDLATDGLISYEIAFQQGVLQAVIPALVQEAFPVAAAQFSQVKAITQARPFQGRLLREWMDGIEASRAAAVRDAVRAGVIEGRTTADIVRTVMGTRGRTTPTVSFRSPGVRLRRSSGLQYRTPLKRPAMLPTRQTATSSAMLNGSAPWTREHRPIAESGTACRTPWAATSRSGTKSHGWLAPGGFTSVAGPPSCRS